MSLTYEILKILADGERHSGVALAARLGVTRAAISKAVAGLEDVPLAVDRKGYVLPPSFWPLNEARITRFLAERKVALDRLTIKEEVDSTNQVLLASPDEGFCACLAERQTAGRGRRGRRWYASPYGNVMVSVSTTWRGMGHPLGVLSLGAGVAVRRALEALGVADSALKWPNDVVWQARKLAGILIEVRGEPEAMRIVIGVGLNGTIGPVAAAAIDQDWVDLRTLLPVVDRDLVAAEVIGKLFGVMGDYREGRGAAILDEWREHHAFAGLRVSVAGSDGAACVGTVLDVDGDGALILEVAGARRIVRSGEMSVRPL
ncbi:MAG: biotin--[acetyl-CoA-carboxylase] ligase [Acidiferrobacter sp.]